MMRKRPGLSASLPRAAALAAALGAQAAAAQAACPIELAVYSEAGTGAGIDFRPGTTAAVTNSFRMVLDRGVVLDGVVMWSQEPARPVGMLMRDCPEGDVTGEELAACTVWEGVIYAVDARGEVGLLPAQGTDAPRTLILADLGRALRLSSVADAAGPPSAPGDVFALSGCQE